MVRQGSCAPARPCVSTTCRHLPQLLQAKCGPPGRMWPCPSTLATASMGCTARRHTSEGPLQERAGRESTLARRAKFPPIFPQFSPSFPIFCPRVGDPQEGRGDVTPLPPAWPPKMAGGNAVQAVRTQCKVLYAGNYLNPSFGPFRGFVG